MKKKLIHFFILAIFFVSLTGCQTISNIIENPDNIFGNTYSNNDSYNPNNPFPSKGYTLQGMTFRNIVINKFIDNDAMYYIKYKTGKDDNKFYYTIINKETADLIISKSKDKNIYPNRYDREKWLDNTLVKMGINNRNDRNSLWTYFEPKRKLVKGNLPTDVVLTGYHYEYEQFNYKTATEKLCNKRNLRSKRTGIEVLGALYLMNLLSNNKQKESEYKTQWDMYSDAQKAVIHQHDNAK